jgi:hypothetical protein
MCYITVIRQEAERLSSGGCTTSLDQEVVEHLGWFQPAERLAWTVVELISDSVELGPGVARV